MNQVMLIGNLTKDPEVKMTPNGTIVCQFTMAVQRKYKDQSGERQADFIQIVAWRQLAELCGEYLIKGKKAAVVGEMNVRTYDAKDGTRRYVTEVVAREVEFLSPKEQAAPYNPPEPVMQGEAVPIDDDLLPF